ncbi:MAG: S49 family peptidase, partial [Candidatus Eisenbacteria bacterium]|nr:S49 family peptidase [Candidatus Eisenbacteria bacterium]
MKRFVLVVLAFIGFISILTFVSILIVIGVGLSSLGRVSIPSRAVLDIDFERPFVETLPLDPVSRFLQDDQLELRAVIDAIDHAADDSRIVALRAEVSGAGLGLAQIQEMRSALERFRKSGKPVIAFAETFGEFGPGNAAYYLASACDRIYLQPSGDLSLTGFYLEHPFVRGTLDKLGIVPRFGQRYEYKNAVNLSTETQFTDAHREASEHH